MKPLMLDVYYLHVNQFNPELQMFYFVWHNIGGQRILRVQIIQNLLRKKWRHKRQPVFPLFAYKISLCMKNTFDIRTSFMVWVGSTSTSLKRLKSEVRDFDQISEIVIRTQRLFSDNVLSEMAIGGMVVAKYRFLPATPV